jgi:hypothetical protein
LLRRHRFKTGWGCQNSRGSELHVQSLFSKFHHKGAPMNKLFLFLLLTAISLTMTPLVQSSFANDAKSTGLLQGKWDIVKKPAHKSGDPCPYIPDTIEFFKDGTLELSNMPDMHMPFKTDLTSDEKDAIEQRPGFKGRKLLLVKPNPRMDWKSTPMVYIYEVSENQLSLTVQGYEKATYKKK